MDLERPERNLFGAMETACCLKTLFSDSKLVHFSSILITLTSKFQLILKRKQPVEYMNLQDQLAIYAGMVRKVLITNDA